MAIVNTPQSLLQFCNWIGTILICVLAFNQNNCFTIVHVSTSNAEYKVSYIMTIPGSQNFVVAVIQCILFLQWIACIVFTVQLPLLVFGNFCCNRVDWRPPINGNCTQSKCCVTFICLSVSFSPCSKRALSARFKVFPSFLIHTLEQELTPINYASSSLHSSKYTQSLLEFALASPSGTSETSAMSGITGTFMDVNVIVSLLQVSLISSGIGTSGGVISVLSLLKVFWSKYNLTFFTSFGIPVKCSRQGTSNPPCGTSLKYL